MEIRLWKHLSFLRIIPNRSFAPLGAFEDKTACVDGKKKLPKCHLWTFLLCLHSGPQSFPLAVALPSLFAFIHFIYVFIYELFRYSHRFKLQKIIKICDSANSLLIFLCESIIPCRDCVRTLFVAADAVRFAIQILASYSTEKAKQDWELNLCIKCFKIECHSIK